MLAAWVVGWHRDRIKVQFIWAPVCCCLYTVQFSGGLSDFTPFKSSSARKWHRKAGKIWRSIYLFCLSHTIQYSKRNRRRSCYLVEGGAGARDFGMDTSVRCTGLETTTSVCHVFSLFLFLSLSLAPYANRKCFTGLGKRARAARASLRTPNRRQPRRVLSIYFLYITYSLLKLFFFLSLS